MTNTYTKAIILEDLKKHDLKIVFTKADGSERTLIATNHVPSEYIPKPKVEVDFNAPTDVVLEQLEKAYNYKPAPDTHLKVFDRENQAWRTIVIERIKEISYAE